jgi:hypothetical protein
MYYINVIPLGVVVYTLKSDIFLIYSDKSQRCEIDSFDINQSNKQYHKATTKRCLSYKNKSKKMIYINGYLLNVGNTQQNTS